jgi:hypothetical protein
MSPKLLDETMATQPFSQQTNAMAYATLRVIKRPVALLLFFGVVWLVSGCTQTVRLPEGFPTPVTQKLPLRIGLYQDRPFRDYVHQDASGTRKTWMVDLRPIHKTLFQTILGALFSELIEIERLPAITNQPSRFDAVIEPQVQAFTLQTPSASASPFYRVSAIYLLKVYSSQGELLGSWPVEGQGQGRSGWLKAGQGVAEAVTNALRDVGAQIVTELAEKPAIRDLLTAKQARDAGTPVPAVEER